MTVDRDRLRKAVIHTLRQHMLNIESWYPATADALIQGPFREVIETAEEADAWPWADPNRCPSQGNHRGPEGPNEDLSTCVWCGRLSWRMRPWGETYGHHADDCSLQVWHESYCQPGGQGHPPARVIRGYWKETGS